MDAMMNPPYPNADPDETPVIELTIPSAISCAPARASRIGGVARVHPYWSALATAPAVTDPAPNWGPGEVTSVDTRSAVTFHRTTGSFQALSVKTGRMISGIGPYEQAQSEELEADPETVAYDLQGLKTAWVGGPSYLSDFHALHVTKGVVAGEVKADRSYFLEQSYAEIMANAKRTFAAVDITFEEKDGTSMFLNQVRRLNVRRAYCDRFHEASPAQTDRVRELVSADGGTTLGRIHSILANDPRTAQQLVHGLLCRRVLGYDLNTPTRSDTLVYAPAKPALWVDIRDIQRTEAA
ncbi:hypothetical protein [Sphingomonas albertensis]|uniref:TnsA endonuclease N-terminal domain-containing protein n=1 Tax=Sphingomonas albertensis TaxID=2762591 RepID=A0ABR7AMK3_9SPHN|nr:hypothetical protein [Sphingomonas albertensis]MBC3941182.1 hypothetical protein [Sphingomonas albertensis]